ncbi:MAG: type I restriction-modification system subunit M N-terminal domain-containing protein [Saprospiraceae bacterium]|nr:type I restriction-modification system subunit M N-terminal domain-containing protein [Saprospiraceae bacterium]
MWAAADQLRANFKLTATEYSFPVLGLLFLRHAFRLFNDAKTKIEASLPHFPQIHILKPFPPFFRT